MSTTTCQITEVGFLYIRNNGTQLFRNSEREYGTDSWSDTAFLLDESITNMTAANANGTLVPLTEVCQLGDLTSATSTSYIFDVGSTVMLGGLLAFFVAYWFIGLVKGRIWKS